MDSQGGQGASSSSDFVRKLYKMLENPSDESVVRWGNEGDSFVVLENEKFTKHILPKHFKHSNFASFVRQLNKYDFHKVRHNNEDNGQSPYGAGAWEFKHPDFKMNNKDALDNIRRKAPAPRKPNQAADEMVPTQQMDLVNSQLVATQQQLQQLQERYNELSIHHSMLLQELIGVQKTVVNHEHVMQSVMSFLHSVDAQRRRDSRVHNPFGQSADGVQNGTNEQQPPSNLGSVEEDEPASPLQHASKLLQETNADVMLNPRNLEHINELAIRMNGTITTPPPSVDVRNGGRPPSRNTAPPSATSNTSGRYGDLDNMVYPVGQTQGIDPMYSEHINNIPYPMPTKPPEPTDPRYHTQEPRKKSAQFDPGWIRQPQILLVEDDPTCRRIGGKFLYAFNCSIDSALDGLEAVHKMNAGSKYDLVLMDIIMPNLDGVSACHLIRQFDSTPIIAMTSNIRSDDISMYFQHGMNDVLPKPFTKEGLLNMLEKHLGHLKKSMHEMNAMGVPQAVQPLAHTSAKQTMKDEDSPGKSPASISTWNSPNQHVPGVSPVGSSVPDDYMSSVQGHPGAYGIQTSMNAGMAYGSNPSTPMGAPRQNQHRRQISDISGGEDMANSAKRQQMYAPSMQQHQQQMNPMQRPR
ncbi:MAG: kinase-regulated stress-responsive transcription factor skn7 [Bathelium mastoideum]|nr:MAG: kinase-regulated stress-responsive transcription factor skn7 [Bathelium mastoideum]